MTVTVFSDPHNENKAAGAFENNTDVSEEKEMPPEKSAQTDTAEESAGYVNLPHVPKRIKFFSGQVHTARHRSRQKGFGFVILIQAVLSLVLYAAVWSALTFGDTSAKDICSEIVRSFL